MEHWSPPRVETEKKRIKAELDAAPGVKQRLRLALERAGETSEDGTPLGRLRCYLYCVSSLVHHARYGGLAEKQIDSVSRLADLILHQQGIQPVKSKRGHFYGELHLALSLAFARNGDTWKASWEQLLSFHYAQRSPAGGPGHEALAFGVRAFRHASLQLAVESFARAEASDLPAAQRARARIERVRATRLMGRLEEARSLVDISFAAGSPEATEMAWERLCLLAQTSGDVAPLVRAVQKGKDHHDESYAIEAFLWTRADRKREWLLRFPTLQSMVRDSSFTFSKFKPHLVAVRALEAAQDSGLSTARRLRLLGDALTEASGLPKLDLEVLLWASVARWLSRAHAGAEFQLLVLDEYRLLCRRLSEGTSEDVLGLSGDLVAKRKKLDVPSTSEGRPRKVRAIR